MFQACSNLQDIVWLQKISIPTPGMVIGNSEGDEGLKSQSSFRKIMEQNWKFQELGGSK